MVRPITVAIEKELNVAFQDLSFGAGVAQITIVVVSASSDEDEQKRICKGYNKVGSFSHLVTGERIRSIDLAIPIDPETLTKMRGSEFGKWLRSAISEKLKQPDLRVPKGFDYESFSRQLDAVVRESRH